MAADELIDFSETLSAIYEATLDLSRWPEALQRITQFVGGVGASIIADRYAPRRGHFNYDHGTDPAFLKAYAETYAPMNPLPVLAMNMAPGVAMSIGDVMPMDAFRATPFFREWMGPQGFADIVAVVLDRDAGGGASVLIRLHDADPGTWEQAAQRLLLLYPHIRRAARIGNLLSSREREAAALSETLSALSAGVFMADRAGRVVYANAAGEGLLGQGGAARAENGRLALGDGEADKRLRAAVIRESGGEASADCFAYDDPEAARWRATVIPLGETARGASTQDGAIAAIFLAREGFEAATPLARLQAERGMTAGEARAAEALIRHGDPRKAAAALGLSIATIKTQLRNVYAKAEVDGHVGLLKRLAGDSGPALAR